MPRDSAHDIDPDQLLKAYTLGYFPMGRRRDDPKTVWVLPQNRGVLRLENARIPRKLRRLIARAPFEVRVDTAFHDVIRACAAPAPGREETWINEPIEEVYCALARRGFAHSVECYADGALVGGLYGVVLGAVFFGESMFSRRDNASKVAMAHLIARLKIGGFRMIDAQFHTEHLAQFGFEETPNAAYQRLLAECLAARGDFYRAGSSLLSAATVSQSITQTS
ncbi:leucyl/phenylalanyl-tRNA--protein transferase [Amphiplicatus metriothermophilus]|uniref:Leucyl/phenylalanyl-tRNA--protein transferase n=1 Tax=Amphiplicatus metriothermophilus TaxID=1519374 RepID=A0A239PVI1_9PROT|nr:leucyl/phenylalanyl-tRNA--protein transferase [Amphiplicatus metriothermophilus]MBB5519616.1 leucyl/phenylalanyl-tRNA--protein transferase [Amphiplicatus metriothermophilus]SNT74180.1 leucyl/phenylalanyl-tRNA--protein transferase [Amphiplicatus metriothermophilus]